MRSATVIFGTDVGEITGLLKILNFKLNFFQNKKIMKIFEKVFPRTIVVVRSVVPCTCAREIVSVVDFCPYLFSIANCYFRIDFPNTKHFPNDAFAVVELLNCGQSIVSI